MSVCDVPPCPNLSVGSIQPLMGAPKGVPRVNRAANETRDRLRIRLNQRKAKHPFNPNVTYSVQFGALSKQAGEECTDKSKKAEPTKPEPSVEKPVCNMTKKCSGETFTLKPTSCPVVKRCCGKKFETKNCPIDFRAEHLKLQKEEEEAEAAAAAAAQAQATRQEHQFEDIDKIMKFIEGKDYDIAQKKAAKKARQKQKKEEEKRKKEEEELVRRKAEEKRIREEKRLEEERLKAIELARQAALRKEKKNKNSLSTTNEVNKGKKKGKKGKGGHIEHSEPELFEETIPAMVTIKRIVENNNSPPTVTITLKGSTPDQDKLLYTLVNGHNNRSASENADRPKDSNKKEESKSNKKKKKGSENKAEVKDIKTKELKVTLAVDKSFRRELENKTAAKAEMTSQKSKKQAPVEIKEKPVKTKAKENIIDIPSLKLPPGITITKVNGPLTNRKVNNVQSSDYQNVPVNKSGVIVVDTEKLIQQSIGTKKNKKKKKKSQQETQKEGVPSKPPATQESSMVTLKNPIFHKIQNTINQPEAPHLLTINEQATISKGANGMVTIRRPRQAALQNESPISEYLAPVLESNQTLMNPNMNACYVEAKSTLSDERKIIRPPSPRPTNSLTNATQIDLDSNRLSAQNVLWELPGIQITRVHKNNNAAYEGDNAAQTADISIIRTSGFNLEKDDWPYESVFVPKDILEDDLDADERELEAFKRFCQQSIPPKHKEKVAHLNVKDIVLMKKNDITYS